MLLCLACCSFLGGDVTRHHWMRWIRTPQERKHPSSVWVARHITNGTTTFVHLIRLTLMLTHARLNRTHSIPPSFIKSIDGVTAWCLNVSRYLAPRSNISEVLH